MSLLVLSYIIPTEVCKTLSQKIISIALYSITGIICSFIDATITEKIGDSLITFFGKNAEKLFPMQGRQANEPNALFIVLGFLAYPALDIGKGMVFSSSLVLTILSVGFKILFSRYFLPIPLNHIF